MVLKILQIGRDKRKFDEDKKFQKQAEKEKPNQAKTVYFL